MQPVQDVAHKLYRSYCFITSISNVLLYRHITVYPDSIHTFSHTHTSNI